MLHLLLVNEKAIIYCHGPRVTLKLMLSIETLVGNVTEKRCLFSDFK